MATLREATQPRDTSNMIAVTPPAPTPPPIPVKASAPGNNPLAIGILPPIFGTNPDFQRNFYRPGMSQSRIPPLPPQANIAAGAAIKSQIIIEAASPAPVVAGGIYDIIFSLGGRPNGSFTYPWLVFVRTVNFLANFGGSQGKVLTNPTSSYVITINKNGASFGTITISTGGVFTFVSTGSTAVANGDYFTVVTPASDPTLTGLMFTLKGSNG